MKSAGVLIASVLLIAIALPSVAGANTVKIRGDIRKDGYLTVDFKWSVDTRDYPGKNRPEIKKAVHDQMYQAMLPELNAKTSGLDLSYDKCNFTILNENSRILQERSDGSKLYSVTSTVRFNAPYAERADDSAISELNAKQKNMVRGNWQREFW